MTSQDTPGSAGRPDPRTAAALRRVSQPLSAGAGAFPAPAPRRGHVDQLVHESLCYRTEPGYRPLFLDLHVPRRRAGTDAAPLVVWVHGGGWDAGSRRRLPVGLERHHLLERVLLAGFAVALVDYRLRAEAPFPAAVDDVAASLTWLRGHAAELGIDSSRLALWGESAGAHVAVLAAARPDISTLLCAVVDWYGPTDLASIAAADTDAAGGPATAPGVDAGERAGDDLATGLRAGGWLAPEASPLTADLRRLPPTLIVHGRHDTLVAPEHSARLRDRLAALGVEVEHTETDGGHVFDGSLAAPAMIARSLRFLAARLDVELGPHPDPQLLTSLAQLPRGVPADPLGTDDPVEARRRSAAFMTSVQPRRAYPVARVTDAAIELPHGRLPLRVQRSARHTDTLLLYVHGGGFVVGDLDSHQAQAARLGATLPAHVVQVDYRRAPEHPFPAAYDDTMAAIRWCHSRLAEFGCRRLVLAGDSAGGNLALAAALECRDAGLDLAALVVNYPATDLREGHVDGLPATYLGGDDAVRDDRRASPAVADLRGLPPVVIGVGGLDFLLEDVLDFAYRLRCADVPTTLRIFPSLPHGYFSSAPLSLACDRASEQICRDASELLWDTAQPDVTDAVTDTAPAAGTVIA